VGLSCVGAPYPQEMYLQHSPTVLVSFALPFLVRRWQVSEAAFSCLVAFFFLHTLGARYIYSNVPYDEWAAALWGRDISSTFGWRRNHFDRLVHLAFGLLWARPIFDVAVRHLHIPRRVAFFTVLELVLAASALYEIFEWGLTIVMSPQDAEEYNGQQGDMWDAQKDMALALLGTCLALPWLSASRRRAVA
jgi:putative membrane protein